MGFIGRLNYFVELYLSVLKNIFKIRLWIPFTIYAILQFGVLVAFMYYVHPHVFPVLNPLVNLLGEQRADIFSHYPGLFLLLPSVVQWGKLLVGIIFEGLAAGLTSVLFLRIYSASHESAASVKIAFSRWLHLLGVWVSITAILLLVNWSLPSLLSDYLVGNPRRLMAFEAMMRLLTVSIYAVFIYAVPSVIVFRDNLLKALGNSLRFFIHNPVFSFFLALIPYLLTLPTSYITDNVSTIVTGFNPELVFFILLAAIVIDLIVNFLVTGTVVKFLVDESS